MSAVGLRPDILLMGAGNLFFFAFVPSPTPPARQSGWPRLLPTSRAVFCRPDDDWQCHHPLAYLLAGPLADRVAEPLMAEGGALAGTVGRVLGVGSGRASA